MASKKKAYLGQLKGVRGVNSVYLTDFSWDCEWYWSGGYIGNRNFHCHFDGCFLDVPDLRGHPLGDFVTPWHPKEERERGTVMRNGCAIWEDVSFFLDSVPLEIQENWWRIKDLFKQFYTLRKAAECFRLGGHCSNKGRTPQEINPEMEKTINSHIETVIIAEIRKIFNFA